MLFNTLQYLVFFVLAAAAFFLLPHRFRWVFMLAASYYFYMCWKPEYAVLLAASTLVDYTIARLIDRAVKPAVRRTLLVLSLTCSLGLLGSFKYLNFVSSSLRSLLDPYSIAHHIPAFNLLLPVGISFFTFQTMGYVIDVYRGTRRAERHLGIYAAFVSFFPQLVAGPIERSTHLLPQFRENMRFDADNVSEGLKHILWGLFKKMVVADRLAAIVNPIYANPAQFDGPSLLIATCAFGFQIYCDFSGYTDIAIGSARILGFRLMRNFNRPYSAASLGEFWRRWHISLSTWFRDYLYIPLGGSRVTAGRRYANLFTVFLISGLWHGANWTFIAWGAFHGAGLVFGIWTEPWRASLRAMTGLDRLPRLAGIMRTGFTFAFVTAGWVLFRAQSIADVRTVFARVFDPTLWTPASLAHTLPSTFAAVDGLVPLTLTLLAVAVLECVQFMMRDREFPALMRNSPRWQRWSFYHVLVLMILSLGVLGAREFIYFQF